MDLINDITLYPEFLLSGILVALLIVQTLRTEPVPLNAPQWLAQPAQVMLESMPQKYQAWLKTTLLQAGWRGPRVIGDYACMKFLLPIAALLLYFALPLQAVIPLALCAFIAPDLILYLRHKQRQKEIATALPQSLDLLVLCVDAGLGLDAALQRMSQEGEAMPNALNDELKQLGTELLFGMDRQQAYEELYNRTGVEEIKTLSSALNQANKLGLSIVKILRAQSEFIRKKQSQKAEEKAMKTPIYMAFPLWFCIMPCLMLLTLGPSLIHFYRQLGPGLGGH